MNAHIKYSAEKGMVVDHFKTELILFTNTKIEIQKLSWWIASEH